MKKEINCIKEDIEKFAKELGFDGVKPVSDLIKYAKELHPDKNKHIHSFEEEFPDCLDYTIYEPYYEVIDPSVEPKFIFVKGNEIRLVTGEMAIRLKDYCSEVSWPLRMFRSFYKSRRKDKIWWVDNPFVTGVHEFSFDKKKIFNLFHDYPHALTDEEKELFDKENPYWAEFFKNRPRHHIKIRCIVDNIQDLTKDKVYEILEEDEEGLWNVANDKDEYYHFYDPSFFEVVETYNETYAKKAISKQ